ncbi:MAG: ATP-binding cassette domain-containing protein [Pseudomonadota bacterium]
MVSLLPLKIENATVRAGGRTLLGPLNLTLDGGGTSALIGPNGAGKTTLLRLIHGLVRPRDGSLAWHVPVAHARARQSFVFQHPILLRRSVLANIGFPLRLAGVRRPDATGRAKKIAADVGLSDHLAAPAMALSAGEKQKLALARALITEPELLILDEPTANLDGRSKREIETILKKAIAGGMRVLIATHDMGQAERLADEVVFLFHGKVHERGEAAGFFASPQTPAAAAFLRGDILE